MWVSPRATKSTSRSAEMAGIFYKDKRSTTHVDIIVTRDLKVSKVLFFIFKLPNKFYLKLTNIIFKQCNKLYLRPSFITLVANKKSKDSNFAKNMSDLYINFVLISINNLEKKTCKFKVYLGKEKTKFFFI